MLGEHIEDPGEGRGDGLGSGRHDGDHLVVNLGVVQAAAVLVVGRQQCGQQVVVRDSAAAVAGDQFLCGAVQIPQVALVQQDLWPVWDKKS